ncbi:MAG: integrase, partial [bacterium]|nr:integrase [bacterium]
MEPWNKGRAVGQKTPFTPAQVWKIRKDLELKEAWRDLALFSVGLDTMLRSSDLLAL